VAIDHKAANRERCTVHRVIDRARKIGWDGLGMGFSGEGDRVTGGLAD